MSHSLSSSASLTHSILFKSFLIYTFDSLSTCFTPFLSLFQVVSVDNPLGANQLVYKPGSLSHLFYPKTANITNSLFVGASPSHSCPYQTSTSDIKKFYGHNLWGGGVNGGNTALVFGSFTSGANSKCSAERKEEVVQADLMMHLCMFLVSFCCVLPFLPHSTC